MPIIKEPINYNHYFKEKSFKTFVPYNVQIDVTNKCNCNCIFCYQGNNHSENEETISYNQIINLLQELRCLGTRNIAYSGGDPFLREDIFDILEYTRKLGFTTTIVTNGHNLHNKDLVRLKDIGLYSVNFSFHSLDYENYNFHFGTKNINPYDIVEKIVELKKLGVNVGVNITITKHNINEISILCDKFEEYGINNFGLNIVAEGKKSINKLMPSNEEFERLLIEYPLVKKRFKKFYSEKSVLTCLAGVNSCNITYDGKVLPCPFLDILIGNIKEQKFSDIWNNSDSLNLLRSIKDENFTKCMKCDFKQKCNMCFARNLKENHNFFVPPQQFCDRVEKILI